MKEREINIAVVGLSHACKMVELLAEKMKYMVVTAEQAQNAFNNIPSFEIKRKSIFPDIFYEPNEN